MSNERFKAKVAEAGGGEVRLFVHRRTERYPEVGSWVEVDMGPIIPAGLETAVIQTCRACGFPHYDLWGRLLHGCDEPHATGAEAIACSVRTAESHAVGCECDDCKVAAWWSRLQAARVSPSSGTRET